MRNERPLRTEGNRGTVSWQAFSFFIPLDMAAESHMDLKQIAIFVWLPFLAADFGGGFAHQTISVLVNTAREVGAVSGFAGMAAWIGDLGFTLLVGALADMLHNGPLFGLLGIFNLIGAAALILLIRGDRANARMAVA